MERYSYEESLRQKRVDKILRALVKFQLTHQSLFLFILGILFSYLLFKSHVLYRFALSLSDFGYLSVFFLGFLSSFGSFTIPTATAVFIMAKNFNPLYFAFVASVAATASNYLVYKLVKHGLLEEMKNVLAQDFGVDASVLEHKISRKIRTSKFLKSSIPALSGILISLPLPTEFLVSVMWTVARYDTRKILFFSFVFSFLGMFLLATASRFAG
ncbi:MAG: hypothetical protein HYT70_02405 [Candidatus Aenigmarchaeota archaeon]|nr:hypothetical protein [Candidatus Aenigmarchaeota archaeon]